MSSTTECAQCGLDIGQYHGRQNPRTVDLLLLAVFPESESVKILKHIVHQPWFNINERYIIGPVSNRHKTTLLSWASTKGYDDAIKFLGSVDGVDTRGVDTRGDDMRGDDRVFGTTLHANDVVEPPCIIGSRRCNDTQRLTCSSMSKNVVRKYVYPGTVTSPIPGMRIRDYSSNDNVNERYTGHSILMAERND